MAHEIGKGIITLIARHEPGAISRDGSLEAKIRVAYDLSDSLSGILAFTAQFHGDGPAIAMAQLILQRIGQGAPAILEQARSKVSTQH